MKLYVIPIQPHEHAGINVADICWGSCGRGIVGGVDIGGASCIPCRTEAAECPHFEREVDSETDLDGDRLFLRKLRARRCAMTKPWREVLTPEKIANLRAWGNGMNDYHGTAALDAIDELMAENARLKEELEEAKRTLVDWGKAQSETLEMIGAELAAKQERTCEWKRIEKDGKPDVFVSGCETNEWHYPDPFKCCPDCGGKVVVK